jgi:hypothetical protein
VAHTHDHQLGAATIMPAASPRASHQMAADMQERVVIAEIGDKTIPDLVQQDLSRHGIFFRRGSSRSNYAAKNFL